MTVYLVYSTLYDNGDRTIINEGIYSSEEKAELGIRKIKDELLDDDYIEDYTWDECRMIDPEDNERYYYNYCIEEWLLDGGL